MGEHQKLKELNRSGHWGSGGRARRTGPILASLAVALLISFLVPATTWAAEGDLDASFDADGKVTTDFGPDVNVHEAVIAPDGDIILAGCTVTGGAVPADFAVARYNPDGSLDTSFDGDGKVTTDFGGKDCAYGLAIAPDGDIVLGGSTTPSPYNAPYEQFALARYNPNGTLDTSFDGDGMVTTDFTLDSDEANALAIDGQGRIIAAGVTSVGGKWKFALARYNATGELDGGFGAGGSDGNGRVTTDISGTNDDVASAVALAPDGDIVLAGAVTGTPWDFALARYNPDGTPDTAFSGDGKLTSDWGGQEQAYALTIDAGGNIIAGGKGFATFAVARYAADGTLDVSFGGGDGLVTTDFGGSSRVRGLAIDAHDRIVAAGTHEAAQNFALARYNPADGGLDTSFSTDGKVTTDFGGNDGAAGVAIDAHDRIVAGGDSGLDLAIARYVGDAVAPLSPTITATSPAAPANDNTPIVRGSGAEAGSTVTLYGDSACTGTALGSGTAADFNGATGIIATVPDDQTTNLRATATDAAGNVSPCSAPAFAYREDSTAPGVTLTTPLSGARTSDSTPTLAGIAGIAAGDENQVTVRLYAGSDTSAGPVQVYAGIATGSDGAYSVDTTPLTDGTYTAQAVQGDSAGNSGLSSATTFTVDTQAPDTQIDSGPTGTTNNNDPSFGFTSDEPGSTFECRLDGPGAATGSFAACSSPKAFTDLADGTYSFQVRATDGAGNTDPSPASRSFTVDTQAPDTQITSGPTGTTNNNDPSFAFTSDEAGSTFECRLDGGAFTPCGSPKTYMSLPDGPHTFAVRATDGNGNTDPTPASRSFTVDTTAEGTATAKQTQKQKGKKIVVKAKVKAGEDLEAKATGKVKVKKSSYKLKSQSKSVAGGTKMALKLSPKKSRDAKKIAKALKKGKKATAKLEVKLADEVGNEATTKLSVKLKR